jgi:HEAT repeat protein
MASDNGDAENLQKRSDSDEEWFQDVAENLDIYARLSIAGQYSKASWYFDDLLNTPDAEFPVVAQHADTLIDQGAFGKVEELLLTYRESHPLVRPEDEERQLIVDLLLANAQVYTKCDTERAAKTVTKALQMVGRVLIDDATPPEKVLWLKRSIHLTSANNEQLQIAVISLRIIDLLLRMPHDRSVSGIDFELPFVTASKRGQDLIWHEVVISMLAMGYVWEAQSLLPICLRHAQPEDVVAPLNILNAIPKEDDAIYTLIRCTMLVDFSEFFASRSLQMLTEMEGFNQLREVMEDTLDLSCPIDGIATPISRSRAYQKLKLFHFIEKETDRSGTARQEESVTPTNSARELQEIRSEAEDHEDYMLMIATYEQSGDSLPYDWLERIGMSKEALDYLHPNVQLSSRIWTQRRIIEQQVICAHDENPNMRDMACEALQARIQLTENAIGELLAILQRATQNEKHFLIQALGTQSVLSEEAVDSVLTSIKDASYEIKLATWKALGYRSHLAEKAFDSIFHSLQSESPTTMNVALDILRDQSQWSENAINSLLALLKYGESNAWNLVFDALGSQLHLCDEDVNTLLTAMKRNGTTIATDALKALRSQTALSASAVDSIATLLQYGSHRARKRAVEVLGKQRQLPDEVIDDLFALLEDDDWDVRRSIFEALGKQAKLPDKVIDDLLGLLRDDDWNVRRGAVEVLGKQAQLPDKSIDHSLASLRDEDLTSRRIAVKRLGKQGQLPDKAIDDLLASLRDNDMVVREEAVEVLGRQVKLPEKAINTFVALIRSDGLGMRTSAIEVLGKQGQLPDKAFDGLLAFMRDEDVDLRRGASEVLEKQSQLPVKTIDDLLASLRDEDMDVKETAVKMLGKQAQLPGEAIDDLLVSLRDEDPDVRRAAFEVLGKHA